jgi:hypothetical protein
VNPASCIGNPGGQNGCSLDAEDANPTFDPATQVGTSWDLITTTTSSPPGDYDGDGTVNEGDYAEWVENFGAAAGADGNGDGVVDAADFVVWRNNLGKTAGSGAALFSEPDASKLKPAAFPIVSSPQWRAEKTDSLIVDNPRSDSASRLAALDGWFSQLGADRRARPRIRPAAAAALNINGDLLLLNLPHCVPKEPSAVPAPSNHDDAAADDSVDRLTEAPQRLPDF